MIAVVVTVSWLVVLYAWSDAPFAFTFDDAYYYFGIARNISAGHGSTFDGINLTNGYHPLWMAISVLPFRLGLDDLDAARALLAIQLVAGWGMSLACIARMVGRLSIESVTSKSKATSNPSAQRSARFTVAIVFTLIAFNPFVVKVFVNGLETGIQVTLLCMVLVAGSTAAPLWSPSASRRQHIGVGMLLALCFLGRTDSVLLIASVFVWWVALARRQRTTMRSALLALLEVFGPAGATLVAYLAYNRSQFGTVFQVSGLVKRAPLTATTLAMAFVGVGIAAYVGRVGFKALHRTKARRVARFPTAGLFAARTAWFGAFCILVIDYYAVLQTQIWLWYFAPLILYGMLLLLLAVVDICNEALAETKDGRSAARRLLPVQAVFFLALAGALLYEISAFIDPNLLSIQIADRDTGVWIRDNIADNDTTVLSSWDAGVVGYFSHRHVVNLDGLVNSFDFYQAWQQGKAAWFLRCERVGYVTNHGGVDAAEDKSFRDFVHDVYGDDAAKRATIVFQLDFMYDGTTTGSAGSTASGLRPMRDYVYQVPPEVVTGANEQLIDQPCPPLAS